MYISKRVRIMIFRVKCKKIVRDYKNVWGAGKTSWSSGTAFSIDINDTIILITAYHVVEDAEIITVSFDNTRKSFSAQCISYCYESDIAVLSISNTIQGKTVTGFSLRAESCYENNYNDIFEKELSRGHAVSVVGYAEGEICSSVTTGSVSKICYKKDTNIMPQMLVELDIKSTIGFSGGPVMDERGKLCGLLLGCNRNFSYMLPAFTLERYLRRYRLQGFNAQLPACCDLGILTKPQTVKLSNGQYRSLPEITSVAFTGSCYDKLYKKDIIFSVCECELLDYDLLDRGVPYWQLIREKDPHDIISIVVLRNGVFVNTIVSLDSEPKSLLPNKRDHIDMSYYIFAGMDFMALNLKYFYPLEDMYNHKDSEMIHIYHKYKNAFTHGDSQVVILKGIFPSHLTYRYSSNAYKNLILTHINGRRVSNLRDVHDICESEQPGTIRFTFRRMSLQNREVIELNHSQALRYSERIANNAIGRKYHNI